jgi:hypothetical protein
MNPRASRPTFSRQTFRSAVAVLCMALLVPGDYAAWAWSPQQPTGADAEKASKIPNDQLDSLVAPIALYPDPLLAQVLVASTYPLEIVQLQQWLDKHKDLKDKALTEAVQKQDWDPSIQAMAVLPDVVKHLSENIKWTTDLGNAFLAQQSDVMDAVQRMRVKAKDTGNLKSTEQQKVEKKVVESKSVIVIEPAKPEVIYVPSYDPVVVYGAPVYPYPTGYYAAGMALSFGVGMMMGAAWGGGWGWNAGWGGNNVYINHNNNFVSHYNRQNVNRAGNQPARGNSTWNHNPQHRGGAPYSNRATANKYAGTARGDSMATRQASARQNQGQTGSRQAGSMDRGGGGPQASAMDRGGGNRTPSASGGGGDRVGNRSVPSGGSSRGSGAFAGGADGVSGSGARASSARGASSMGGGGRRGGGGGRRR